MLHVLNNFHSTVGSTVPPTLEPVIPESFLPFGVAYGDSVVPFVDDGSSEEIRLTEDVVLFGSRQNRSIFVSH